MAEISNWGMYPRINATIVEKDNASDIGQEIIKYPEVIARGNGRCYGDSALNNHIISTLRLNKILQFDATAGIIKAEAGVLLNDILKVIVPQGYFLPVAPGTKYITVGGAVASNIHGKNHHTEGAISNYIKALDIILDNGEVKHCSPTENVTLYKNTIGGMGLTGIIVSVTIRLKAIETSFIKQKSIRAKNIDEVLDLFETYASSTYSVAWIDCLSRGTVLGRSILMLGEHASKESIPTEKSILRVHPNRKINIPFTFPSFVLNTWSVKVFNYIYYFKQLQKETNRIVHYNNYFFPLDIVNNWNKIYGKAGFTQYQFVIPFVNGKEGLKKILGLISASGNGSFLAVLKTMGAADEFSSPLSFPMPGYTMALDFKITPENLKLMEKLDKLVLEYKGRLYLTKDARMSKEMFRATYPTALNLTEKFHSFQSNRLHIQ